MDNKQEVRLVDANTVRESLRKASISTRFVDAAPTVDAVPVVHGRWLNFYGDFSMAGCSECAETYEVSQDEIACEDYFNAFKKFYKHCPNCGAKMDRKEGAE